MPKKFKGENSKATEAKARKNAAKDAEDEKKQRELEDEYWQDDDKHVLKKQQRKEEKEKKKIEQLEKKKETQKLLEEELVSIKAKVSTPGAAAPSAKVTRLQAEAHQAAIVAAATKPNDTDRQTSVTDLPLEENINRLVMEGEEARTVEQALSLLSAKEVEEIDMHPEKRMKAAYLAYEERRLVELREENPSLRLSQLKQMIRKEWMKSPDNPLNQAAAAAASSK